MLANLVLSFVAVTASIQSTVFAHPVIGGFHGHAHHHRRGHVHKRAIDRSLKTLVDGNQRFIQKIASSEDPNVLKTLAEEGQAPPFMFLGCADSRVNDGTIFDAAPGTFFTERNIANQYHKTDINAQATLAYGLTELGVEHVVVMGHYGCGGVGASIASAPDGGVDAAGASVQSWIQPIRNIFESSTREEIVTLRDSVANATVVEEPEIDDPGFKALVEENVKATVRNIASDSIIVNLYKQLSATPVNDTAPVNGTAPARRSFRKRSGEEVPLRNVFIHGLVYDITTGTITDLGVSVGPPGVEIPTFASLTGPADPAAPVAPITTSETIPTSSSEAPVATPVLAPAGADTKPADIIHTFFPPKSKRRLNLIPAFMRK